MSSRHSSFVLIEYGDKTNHASNTAKSGKGINKNHAVSHSQVCVRGIQIANSTIKYKKPCMITHSHPIFPFPVNLFIEQQGPDARLSSPLSLRSKRRTFCMFNSLTILIFSASVSVMLMDCCGCGCSWADVLLFQIQSVPRDAFHMYEFKRCNKWARYDKERLGLRVAWVQLKLPVFSID